MYQSLGKLSLYCLQQVLYANLLNEMSYLVFKRNTLNYGIFRHVLLHYLVVVSIAQAV